MVTHVSLDGALSLVSAVAILGFAFPSYYVCVQYWGGRGLGALVLLGGYALLTETVAVETGFPYGAFSYSPLLGRQLFEAVPWTVAFAWTPLVLGTLTLAQGWVRLKNVRQQAAAEVLLSALLLVLIDLQLDPAAVALGFWTWEHPAGFYAVPWSNFLGWFLSGTLGSMLARFLLPSARPWPPAILRSLVGIVVFWAGACLSLKLWLPLMAGLAMLLMVRRHTQTGTRRANFPNRLHQRR